MKKIYKTPETTVYQVAMQSLLVEISGSPSTFEGADSRGRGHFFDDEE